MSEQRTTQYSTSWVVSCTIKSAEGDEIAHPEGTLPPGAVWCSGWEPISLQLVLMNNAWKTVVGWRRRFASPFGGAP